MTTETINIHQRLAQVMSEVTYIQKERKDGVPYTIVPHDAVTSKVRPALLSAGVIYYPTRCEHAQNGNRAECSMTVRFANIDNPEDCIDVQTFGYGVDSQDKGPGKAMSYAVKYALLKALGLETGDDADHDSIDHDTKDPATKDTENAATRDRIKAAIQSKNDAQSLEALWKHQKTEEAVRGLHPAMQAELQKAYSDRMGEVFQAPAQAAE